MTKTYKDLKALKIWIYGEQTLYKNMIKNLERDLKEMLKVFKEAHGISFKKGDRMGIEEMGESMAYDIGYINGIQSAINTLKLNNK